MPEETPAGPVVSRRGVLVGFGTALGAFAAGSFAEDSGGRLRTAADTARAHPVGVGLVRVFPSDVWRGSVGDGPVSVRAKLWGGGGSAKGTFAGEALDVRWEVRTESAGRRRALIEGTFAQETVALEGRFDLGRGARLRHGSVSGTLGRRKVRIEAGPVPPSAAGRAAVQLKGTVGETRAALRITDRTGAFPRGKLSGTVEGAPVHLGTRFGVDTLGIGGVWAGPRDLLGLALGALLLLG